MKNVFLPLESTEIEAFFTLYLNEVRERAEKADENPFPKTVFFMLYGGFRLISVILLWKRV